MNLFINTQLLRFSYVTKAFEHGYLSVVIISLLIDLNLIALTPLILIRFHQPSLFQPHLQFLEGNIIGPLLTMPNYHLLILASTTVS